MKYLASLCSHEICHPRHVNKKNLTFFLPTPTCTVDRDQLSGYIICCCCPLTLNPRLHMHGFTVRLICRMKITGRQ